MCVCVCVCVCVCAHCCIRYTGIMVTKAVAVAVVVYPLVLVKVFCVVGSVVHNLQ